MAENKKEYTLKINGIEQSIKDVTKLEEAVTSLDASLTKVGSTTVKVTGTAKERTKSLTDEEKAEQKLLSTIDKVVQARSEANRAQIDANMAARETQRQVVLEQRAANASANSIEAMRIELSRLKDEWKNLDIGTEEFRKMSEEILQLNNRIKEAEQSTGDFRRNVGNYQSALEGLGKLSEGIEGVSKSSMGLAQGLLGINSLMSLFGEETEEDAKRAQQLQKIITLLSIAQQVNTNVLKEGIVQGKLSAVTTAIQTAQLKAKTAAEAASTKGTVAATVAQKIFNVVASANPYVILALALVAVGAALFAFVSNTEDATDAQKKLNEAESNYLDSLDREDAKLKTASDLRIAEIDRQIRVLESLGNKDKQIADLRKKRIEEEISLNQTLATEHAGQILMLESNRKKLDEYYKVLEKLQKAQRDGSNKLTIDIDLDGKVEKVDVEKAIEQVQASIDNTGRKVQVAVDIVEQGKDLLAQQEAEANEAKKKAADRAKERAKTEVDAQRAAEDARLKLIENSDEQARKLVQASYTRQIEDLRKRLQTEQGLTAKARQAIRENIVNLEKLMNADLNQLEKDRAARALGLQREVEDSRLNNIRDSYAKQYAEINAQYDRQIADYQKRLDEDKTLTEEQQKQITELILNAQTARGNALATLVNNQLSSQAEQTLSTVETELNAILTKVNGMVVRDKKGLKLINVEATRKNLQEANAALAKYVTGIEKYKEQLTQAQEEELKELEKGTPEYEAAVARYALAWQEANIQIKYAQNEIAANTKQLGNLSIDYFKDLFGRIGNVAKEVGETLNSVFEPITAVLNIQIENLNEQLDALNERYEEAQKQREDAVKNVEDVEARLQEATGGTAEALRAQLQDSMHAREEAEREEQRLAKEKEKREADIARKEKQIKKMELIGNIAMAIANTAQGVTKALSLIFPLNLAVAGIVGALGAVEVGVMTKQLTKLADGGEIIGPSHANGGVPILVNGEHTYEAQGGEFMVNDKSYGANKALVNFINDTPRAITGADLIGLVPGAETPVIVTDTGRAAEDRLVEAIQGIDMHPTVAVTDILDETDDVVTVRDISGF